MNLKKIKLGIIFVVFISVAYGLPSDRDEIAHLAAESADLNQTTHQGIYIGQVQFDQGTTHLRAHLVVTTGNNDNKLVYAKAVGRNREPAHYWEQVSLQKPVLHAFAREIHYYPEKHIIELIGQARVSQGNDSFAAPKISYDTLKQHVISENNGRDRTLIVIHPGKKNG